MEAVILYTERGIVRGDLDLTTVAGQEIRLLDALNFPQRLRSRAHRLSPGLLLAGVVRRCTAGEAPAERIGELVVRTDRIVGGHEARLVTAGSPSATYERQRERSEERVVLFLSNGLRVEGDIRGGLGALEANRQGAPFVACCRVDLSNPAAQSQVRHLPFLAVNTQRVDCYGSVDA